MQKLGIFRASIHHHCKGQPTSLPEMISVLLRQYRRKGRDNKIENANKRLAKSRSLWQGESDYTLSQVIASEVLWFPVAPAVSSSAPPTLRGLGSICSQGCFSSAICAL